VTVLVGLFCLVLGITAGFAVALRQRLVNPVWLEAVGTWVGAGVTLLAVILAGIVFFSEDYARHRQRRREEDAERSSLQLAANLVFCDVRLAGTYLPIGNGMVAVDKLEIEADNRSGSVVTDVVCELRMFGFEWSKVVGEPIDPGKTVRREFPPWGRLEVRQDGRDLRANANFTFSLDGHRWSRRYGQPAVRQDR
jgi:hypothetical protein